MKKNNNKLLIIAVCLAVIFALTLLCGCDEQNDESVADVSVNAEVSKSQNDASIDMESSVYSETEESVNDESSSQDANDTSKPEESIDIPSVDLDAVFNDALDLLDMYYNFDAEYIVSELIRQGAGESYERISAEKFEGLMYKLFYVDDELLQEVRDYANYNSEDQTYELACDLGAGGIEKTRDYNYYVENGNTYEVYFSQLNYEYLYNQFPDRDSYNEFLEQYVASDDFGDSVEYNGVCWEFDFWNETFYRFIGFSDFGRKYTVEYNDGVVRLLSCEEYDNRAS